MKKFNQYIKENKSHEIGGDVYFIMSDDEKFFYAGLSTNTFEYGKYQFLPINKMDMDMVNKFGYIDIRDAKAVISILPNNVYRELPEVGLWRTSIEDLKPKIVEYFVGAFRKEEYNL